MKKTLLVYWPKKGSVEMNAHRIAETFGREEIDVSSIRETDPAILSNYRNLIIGCSTVGADNWQDAWSGNPWTRFFIRLDESQVDLSGKKIALFGLGDQIKYPEHFVNEMDNLKTELEKKGAKIVGKWPAKDYENTDSKALDGGFFIGLALDEDNQPGLSEKRIRDWTHELKKVFL